MQLTVGCWAANLIASMYVKVTSLLLSKKNQMVPEWYLSMTDIDNSRNNIGH